MVGRDELRTTCERMMGEQDTEWVSVLMDLTLDKRIFDDGSISYYNDRGELHGLGDKPAVILADGTQEWWVNDKRHRDGDKPAYIRADGSKEWYDNGELHREGDKPAVIYADGSQEWWVNGVFRL